MLPWQFYIVLVIMAVASNLLYMLKSKQDDFAHYGGWKKAWVRAVSIMVPLVLIGLPFNIWWFSGFQPADARTAEKIITQNYLANGAQQVEVHFVVKDRDNLTGYANVGFPDGSAITTKCQAEMGEDGQFLAFCS